MNFAALENDQRTIRSTEILRECKEGSKETAMKAERTKRNRKDGG